MKRLLDKIKAYLNPSRETQLNKATKRVMSDVIDYIDFCKNMDRQTMFFDSEIIGFDRYSNDIKVNSKERIVIMNQIGENLKTKGYNLSFIKSLDMSTYEIHINFK